MDSLAMSGRVHSVFEHAINLEVEKTQSEIKELDEYIKRNEELLGKRLKIINSNYSIGYLKVILSSTSLSDFFNNIYIIPFFGGIYGI
jgi:peptidoglycan hydrolase CwlO-like protein